MAFAILFAAATSAQAAQPAVGLGTATEFAVLGASTVTNTGPTVANGDLGVSPGASIVGFPPGIVNGSTHAADPVANLAQTDLTVAYDDAAGRGPAALLPADIGGLFLTAGVYRRASSLGLTGNATFDAQGDPDAVFIVQVGTALTTASNSRVLLVGGAQACNVIWQIGSSATLGTATDFKGVILARQSITLNTVASVQGRVLARGGAVTLDSNTVNRGTCTTAPAPGGTAPPAAGAPTEAGAPGTAGTSGGTTPPAGSSETPGGSEPRGSTGAALLTTSPAKVGRAVARTGTSKCVDGTFKAIVRGANIRSVNFFVDGRSVAIQRRAPFGATIRLHRGTHKLRAHVAFTDRTRSRDIAFRFRACTRQAKRVAPTPAFLG